MTVPVHDDGYGVLVWAYGRCEDEGDAGGSGVQDANHALGSLGSVLAAKVAIAFHGSGQRAASFSAKRD